MTVAELIEKLSRLNPDARVEIIVQNDGDNWAAYPLATIEEKEFTPGFPCVQLAK